MRSNRIMEYKMKHYWLVGIALCASAITQGAVHARASAALAVSSGRQTLELADGWRFKQDDALQGAEAPDFSDADWAQVSVPHTWNRVGNYLPNPEQHINRVDNLNKTQGIGWYRLNFNPPAAMGGKKLWLEFDAASRTAEVWLNGKSLGQHRGGFSRFRFDATDLIRPGHLNVLAVKTDNSKPVAGSSTSDVLPLTGDFFVHGGLYRPVRLVATDPVHFEMLDYGGPGIYARTASVAPDNTTVAVRAKIRNDSGSNTRLAVIASLVDDRGTVRAQTRSQASLEKGAATEIPLTLKMRQARLWQGVDDPYLYRLVVQLARGGRIVDVYDEPFGIREMRFDADKGFFLNGRPYKLRGAGYHQDLEGKGWAVSGGDVERDVSILREMGATSIRLTHYQHGKSVHDIADRQGMILWDEIPLVTGWTVGKETEALPALTRNMEQQLKELIRQNYNHASVATWGIANEVDFGNSIPFFLSNPGGPLPDPLPMLRSLNAIAKSEDLSRPTSIATCCEKMSRDPKAMVPITAPTADLGGHNRYFGWYVGVPDDLEAHLDALRRERPSQPMAVTEYGAGGATTMHTDNPLGGPVDSGGRAQPEEYMNHVHERNWAILATKPYLWATWLWSSFDFATAVRREGDADDINTKGLVTYDRKIRKDPYFFYKANWSTAPTVYITGRRYAERAYAFNEVRVYSNAPSTTLTVNGQFLGARSNCPTSICTWANVRLAEGSNTITATGKFTNVSVDDRVEWRLSSEAASATRIDSGALMAAEAKPKRFGSDNFFAGGEAGTVNKPANWGQPTVLKKIAGTTNSELVATYREGDFKYRIPVTNGLHQVALTFMEPGLAAGQRKFDVVANGSVKLPSFDVARASGGSLRAVRRTFPVNVQDGLLELHFRPLIGKAIVSAIEITSAR